MKTTKTVCPIDLMVRVCILEVHRVEQFQNRSGILPLRTTLGGIVSILAESFVKKTPLSLLSGKLECRYCENIECRKWVKAENNLTIVSLIMNLDIMMFWLLRCYFYILVFSNYVRFMIYYIMNFGILGTSHFSFIPSGTEVYCSWNFMCK